MIDKKGVGYRLISLRLSRGLTRDDVSAAIHLPVKVLADIENGSECFDLDCLIAFATYFQVPIDYLLGSNNCVEKHPGCHVASKAIAALNEEDLRYIEDFVVYLKNKQALPPRIGTKSAG